jgi:hypothetical protein
MPTAPVAGPQVAPGNMPGPMLNPSAATPEAFGAGIGRSIQQVGGVLQQIYREEQEKADNLALTDAVSQAYKADAKHRYSDGADGGLPGIAVMQGDQLFANAAKVSQSFQNELNGISEKLTPNQRMRFTQATQSMRGSFESSVAVRIAQERHRRADEVSRTSVNTISDYFQQRSAQNPAETTADGVLEAATAIGSAIELGAQNQPSPPPKDVLDERIREETYKALDPVIEGLLKSGRHAQAQELLKDKRLSNVFSPKMRAHAEERVREHAINDVGILAAEKVYAEGVDQSKKYGTDLSPEQSTAAVRRYALERIEMELPGEQNAKQRAVARAKIDAMADEEYQIGRFERAGMMDALTKEMFEGKQFDRIKEDFRWRMLSSDQQIRLGQIAATINAPSTEAQAQRLETIKAAWGRETAPEGVKQAISQWQYIHASGVPDVKRMIERAQPNSPEAIIAQHLVPGIGNLSSASTAQEIKAAQDALNYFWPQSAKEMQVIIETQQKFQKDLSSEGAWDAQYDKQIRKIANDYADIKYPNSNQAGQRKQFEAELVMELSRSKTSFDQYGTKTAPVPEEAIRQRASELSVKKASTPGTLWGTTDYSFEELLELPQEKAQAFEKNAFIPYAAMDGTFKKAAREKARAISGGKAPTQSDIEKAGYILWRQAKESARPRSAFDSPIRP